MTSVGNLFAAAGLPLLALGLVASAKSPGFDVIVGRWQGGLGAQVPFYCLAALFGTFAVLYSFIPLSSTMAGWHFWCSFIGVTLAIIGGAVYWLGPKNVTEPWTWDVYLMALALFGGVAMFLVVQLWFVVDLVMAIFRMSKA